MVISSIDLKDGHVVQLKNGKDLVLQRDDADNLIKDFNFCFFQKDSLPDSCPA